jgi:uncharacterized protein YjiS (DUF1127 family)
MSQYEGNLSIYEPQADGLRRFGGWLAAVTTGFVATALAWRERARSRQHLASLDDYMLRDIGLDRASASAEADKAFWNH